MDSILIDEARTPLIIAAPDAQSSDFYKAFARIATNLEKDKDYDMDEKKRTITITDAGVEKVEKLIGVQNIYAPENIRLVHYMEESIKAKALFQRDKDYVVKDGQILIVDEFTGRLLIGRRYQAGLHQAIEAKEGVNVQQESRTYAKVSIQNYFRMYKKISGMTGTAQTSAEEFFKVYKLEVESIPPNRGLARKDQNDLIYKNFAAKLNAIAADVKERQKKGQPVLAWHDIHRAQRVDQRGALAGGDPARGVECKEQRARGRDHRAGGALGRRHRGDERRRARRGHSARRQSAGRRGSRESESARRPSRDRHRSPRSAPHRQPAPRPRRPPGRPRLIAIFPLARRRLASDFRR